MAKCASIHEPGAVPDIFFAGFQIDFSKSPKSHSSKLWIRREACRSFRIGEKGICILLGLPLRSKALLALLLPLQTNFVGQDDLPAIVFLAVGKFILHGEHLLNAFKPLTNCNIDQND